MIQDLRSSTSHTKRHRLLTGSDGQETAGVVGPSVVSALSEHHRFRTGADDQEAAGCPSPAASASSPLPGLGGPTGPAVECDMPDGSKVTVDQAKVWLSRFWTRGARRLAYDNCAEHVADYGSASVRGWLESDFGLRAKFLSILRDSLTEQLTSNRVLSRIEIDVIKLQAEAMMNGEFDRILILDDAGLF